MDSADEAQLLEEYERMDALSRFKASAGPCGPPHNGPVLCLDCATPIPLARLVAHPQAVRCIDCQTDYEREQKLYALDGWREGIP